MEEYKFSPRELVKINKNIESLSNQVSLLIKSISKLPDFLPVSLLTKETGKSRQTIRNHLISNYEPEQDFKIENAKLLIASNVFVAIKEYYDNKNK